MRSLAFGIVGPAPVRRVSRVRAFSGAVGALVVLTGGLGACATDSGEVMTVGSTTISRDELKAELEAFEQAQLLSVPKADQESLKTKIHGSDVSKKTYSPEFVAFLLNDLMIDAAITSEAAAQKVTLKSATSAKARADLAANFGGEATYKKLPTLLRTRVERRQREFEALVANASSVAGDAKLYFEKNKKNYVTVCASHILVATKEEAQTIEAELATGGDFAALAKAKSTDTGSGAAGGELGCTSPSTYVPEFAAATIAQPLNAVGEPVQSQFGYHIIKVTKRTEAKFEDVKAQIEGELSAAPERAVSEKLVARLKKAKITVDPKYAKLDPVGDQGFPRIVPKTTKVGTGATVATGATVSSVASSK